MFERLRKLFRRDSGKVRLEAARENLRRCVAENQQVQASLNEVGSRITRKVSAPRERRFAGPEST